MPHRAKRPCAAPGCTSLVSHGRYCAEHRHLAARNHIALRQARKDYEQRVNRPSASERGYDADWQVIRARFLAEHPRCPCGERATLVHHIIPLAAGGTNDEDNLVALCASCHNKVHQNC